MNEPTKPSKSPIPLEIKLSIPSPTHFAESSLHTPVPMLSMSSIDDSLEALPENLLKESTGFLNFLHTKIQPWTAKQWQTWVSVFISSASAISTASTSAKIGSTILNYCSDTFRYYLTWPLTISALTPTLLLSLMGNLTVWNQFLRYLPDLTVKDIKNNIAPLTATFLSSIVSAYVNWDKLDDQALGYRLLLTFFRALSAISVNGLFAVNLAKEIKGFKNSHEMNLLLNAQTILEQLEKQDPLKYLEIINKLFTLVSMPGENSRTTLNDIVLELLAICEKNEVPMVLTPSCKTTLFKTMVLLISLASCLPFFKPGEKFVESILDTSPALIYSLAGILGGSSVIVNASIVMTAIFRRRNVYQGTCNRTLLPKLICLPGLTAVNVGFALNYPAPIDHPLAAGLEAAANVIASPYLGSMAIDNFFDKLDIAYQSSVKNLLDNALKSLTKGDTLINHVTILPESDKAMLIKLVSDRMKWAFEALRSFLNETPDETIDKLLYSSTKQYVNTFFSQDKGSRLQTPNQLAKPNLFVPASFNASPLPKLKPYVSPAKV